MDDSASSNEFVRKKHFELIEIDSSVNKLPFIEGLALDLLLGRGALERVWL